MYRKLSAAWAVALLLAVLAVTSGCAAGSLLPGLARSDAGTGAAQPGLSAQAEPAPYTGQVGLDAASLETSLMTLYETASPSVVYVGVPPAGSGSGFVYSADGYIVTNNHVVQGGSTYEIVFASGERMRAELVGADADSDLAVLKVGRLPDGVVPLELAETVSPGQLAVAIGSPFGERGSMSLGIVSAVGRSLSAQNGNADGGYSLPSVI